MSPKQKMTKNLQGIFPQFNSFEAPHDLPLAQRSQLADEQLHTAVEQRFVRLLQAIQAARAAGFNGLQKAGQCSAILDMLSYKSTKASNK